MEKPIRKRLHELVWEMKVQKAEAEYKARTLPVVWRGVGPELDIDGSLTPIHLFHDHLWVLDVPFMELSDEFRKLWPYRNALPCSVQEEIKQADAWI